MSTSSVSFLTISIPNTKSNAAKTALRLILYKNELYRLAHLHKNVHVCFGTAWVTANGQDIILSQGKSASFTDKNTIISALGNTPLVLEIQTQLSHKIPFQTNNNFCEEI